MRTIAVLNQKGGVGKTTTVVNTAAALAASGAKVIAIDFDPQAHLTIHLGIEPAAIDSGAYKVLTQSARLESEIMMVRPNLWLLPANIDLVGAESELVSIVGREIILREALEECQQHFDYCIIDCAPSLGLLTLNALAAAEEVLIPLQPHFLALQGFGKLLQTVELVNRRINPGLKVNGILLCMFDSRASLPNEVKADIERFLNDARGTNSAWAEAHVLPILVRRNIKLAEAPSYGQTIFEYESSCHGAEDYQKVAEFIHSQTHQPEEPASPERIQEEMQQSETGISSENSNQEQEQDSAPYESAQQDDFQREQQSYEEEPQVSSHNQADYTSGSHEEMQQSGYETSSQYSTPEQVEDSIPYETEQQDDSQGEQQACEEELLAQSDLQSDHTGEINESPAENIVIQEETDRPDYEASQDYSIVEQNEYSASVEMSQHDDSQNQEQMTEDSQQVQAEIQPEFINEIREFSSANTDVQDNLNQPEQPGNLSQYSNETPPIEIREIGSYNSNESDQYAPASEEENQPDQTDGNPESEHREY